jgi:hypothetical protein
MEVYKRFNVLLVFLLIIFFSCTNSVSKSDEIAALRIENQELRKRAQEKQKILDNWFNDFLLIQNQINSINTEELLDLEFGSSETIRTPLNDKDVLLAKVEKIKALIDKKERLLENTELKYAGIDEMISGLRYAIREKEKIIVFLKKENEEIKRINRIISHELDSTITKNNGLATEINLKDLELNKRYVFLVSTLESKVFECNSLIFPINNKFNDVEVVSFHPIGSYKLSKHGNSTEFQIYDEKQFWSTSKYLIVRIRSRHL